MHPQLTARNVATKEAMHTSDVEILDVVVFDLLPTVRIVKDSDRTLRISTND